MYFVKYSQWMYLICSVEILYVFRKICLPKLLSWNNDADMTTEILLITNIFLQNPDTHFILIHLFSNSNQRKSSSSLDLKINYDLCSNIDYQRWCTNILMCLRCSFICSVWLQLPQQSNNLSIIFCHFIPNNLRKQN